MSSQGAVPITMSMNSLMNAIDAPSPTRSAAATPRTLRAGLTFARDDVLDEGAQLVRNRLIANDQDAERLGIAVLECTDGDDPRPQFPAHSPRQFHESAPPSRLLCFGHGAQPRNFSSSAACDGSALPWVKCAYLSVTDGDLCPSCAPISSNVAPD